MLVALETGVKGGKWFSLMDKVYAGRNLAAAWHKVSSNKSGSGIDGQTIHDFARRADWELDRLAEGLRTERYTPRLVKRTYIPKPGSKDKRPLGIPTVRDRVAQTALKHVLEPIFETTFSPSSFGFRPGCSCKDALRRVQDLLNRGYTHVLDADLQKYFDTIPHEPLMKDLEERIADSRILDLVRSYLKAGIMDGLTTWTPDEGSPQGAVISPLLANIYLHPVDIAMMAAGYEMVRYADDIVVLCRSEAEAEGALKRLQDLTRARGLTLHPTKTRIVDANNTPGGFEFLGYRFERGNRWPRKKSLGKLKEAIRPRTKRANGHSLQQIIADLNPILRGWFNYFKHAHHNTFQGIDGWVRMRLRSILRKRKGKRGRGRGSDHQRWPNAFFKEAGLFSMMEARQLLCRP